MATGRRRDLAIAVLVVWTVFVWGGRLRNLIRGDEDAPVSLVLAVGFCLGAVLVTTLRLVGGSTALRAAVRLLGIVTIGVWIVRGVQIAVADHPIGFVFVHTLLALASIVVAIQALRAVSGPVDHGDPASSSPVAAR